MKLLNKTSLIILTVTIFIFFLGGIVFYRIIQTMIIKRVDKELFSMKHNLTEELKKGQSINDACLLNIGNVKIAQMDSAFMMPDVFKDTVLFDSRAKLYSPFRQLEFCTSVDNRKYKVSVSRSMIETENLIEQIVFTMILMLLAYILALYYLNRYLFGKIWVDFLVTIKKVKNFNLHDNPDLNLPYSEVEEFQLLNHVLERLTKRINRDYMNLKEFTENASHEIQTPLSIMHSKIEILLQYPGYSEEQVSHISKLNEAVNRLSNINKVLILLTRIENNQFPELSKVHLKERLEYHLGNFKEIMESKNIKVEFQCANDVELNVNSGLMDILVINLLKNAFRHNFQNGRIIINLESNFLQICNTGPKHNISPDQLFNRFVKTPNNPESLGLGLSLVKKICELYVFKVGYSYEEDFHKVEVRFDK